VSKLNAAGSALLYSTYLGGTGLRYWGSGIAVDAAGNAYVTGQTDSSEFPHHPGRFPDYFRRGSVSAGRSRRCFCQQAKPAGSALLYSTYLGGTE
jgi:hypothetical protein